MLVEQKKFFGAARRILIKKDGILYQNLNFFEFPPEKTVIFPNLHMQILNPPRIFGHKGAPGSFCPRAPNTHKTALGSVVAVRLGKV